MPLNVIAYTFILIIPVATHNIEQEKFSPTFGGRSVIGSHHQRNYHIIPTNKLGQDIFIRATELEGLTNIIRMPSGDMKPVKVPVSKNMLDSHLRGKFFKKVKTMVAVTIADAEVFNWEITRDKHWVCIYVLPCDSEFPYLVYLSAMQFPRVRGMKFPQYTVAIRLTPDRNLPSELLLSKQSARTCGSNSDDMSSELELVKWNEVFFFKVDSPVSYL